MADPPGGARRIEHVIALVGGSPLPVYLAVCELRPSKVDLLCSRDSRGYGNKLQATLNPALDGADGDGPVRIGARDLDPQAFSDNYERVLAAVTQAPQAVLVYTGGTKSMAVAAEAAWWQAQQAAGRDQHEDRLPLHVQGIGSRFFLVNEERQRNEVTLAPPLADVVALEGWTLEGVQQTDEPLPGRLWVHHDVSLTISPNVTRHYHQVWQAGSRMTFVRRITQGQGEEPKNYGQRVKLQAMRIAYEAHQLGGDYARGALLTSTAQRDVENQLALGWASPSPPRIFPNDHDGHAELRCWARGFDAQM